MLCIADGEMVAITPCRLLLIDSDPVDADLAGALLAGSFPECELVIVADAIAFAELLAAGGFSVVIAEQALGWALGTDVLATFSARHPGTATVLFARSIPHDIQKLRSRISLHACLKKDEAGFLKLAAVVESAMYGGQRHERQPSGAILKEQKDNGLHTGKAKEDPGILPPADRFFSLRKLAAEVFHQWELASLKSRYRPPGSPERANQLAEWKIRQMNEDFRITWDEKLEMYVLDAQQARLNARYLRVVNDEPLSPAEFLLQTKQISKRKKQTRKKYRKIHDESEIRRRKERAALDG